METFRLPPGFRLERVAAEPLVMDPVAIDWDADGSLWVCEMGDYPAGVDGQWLPGGRIKRLYDRDGDGVCDEARIFLEGVAFPTGLMVWRRGVLICAAPEILYAEDTDGDGRADRVEKLFTGFATDNYQARVNGLSLGLDNWIHGANGLLGGMIRGVSNTFFSGPIPGMEVNLRNRDFRFRPGDGRLETVSGLSQQGRVRDDWGNWFGCDNSRMLLHYPWDDRYLGRNPQVNVPDPIRHLTGRPGGNVLFPSSRLLERYNDPDQANRVTSACGLGLYRDDLFGGEWFGNAFICEAVHNLVHREVLTLEDGVATSRRPDPDEPTEFLTSTDHWFRPAQVRTGPDGALYVVDMYRFLIEHPRWIPATRLARIDVRAGSDRGRIYRVRPLGVPLRPVRDLTRLTTLELAKALESPNGTERDRVHAELLLRGTDKPALTEALEAICRGGMLAQVRIQALAVLQGLGGVRIEAVGSALRDPDARVRGHAVGVAESMLVAPDRPGFEALLGAVLELATDPSPGVRRQLAFTLGEVRDLRAGEALASLATHGIDDPGLRLAVLSSSKWHSEPILRAVLSMDAGVSARDDWIPTLIATLAGADGGGSRARALEWVLPPADAAPDGVRWNAFARLMEGWDRAGMDGWNVAHAGDDLGQRWKSLVSRARERASDEILPMEDRRLAIRVVAGAGRERSDIGLLARLAAMDAAAGVRQAALEGLRRHAGAEVADRLLEQWLRSLPGARAGILGLLLDRPEWSGRLLEAVGAGTVMPSEISLSQRQRLVSSPDANLRERAARVFPGNGSGNREAVIERYRKALGQLVDPVRGGEVFTRMCAGCHVWAGSGHAVGPNLSPLRVKDSEYWLLNILDPNAAVEPRFIQYEVELDDGSRLSGLIQSETATGLTLVEGGGVVTTLPRSRVVGLRAGTMSMMPEGLEEGVTPEEMAELIAFLRGDGAGPSPERVATRARPAAPETSGSEDPVLRTAAAVARFVLDESQGGEARATAIRANPQFAGALIREMTRDLTPGTPEEYRRIPWLWQVAIAAGRRNDDAQVRAVLEAGLPGSDESLRDWQAVVLGGGVINGISQRQLWPGERIEALVAGHPALETGWKRALELAADMADREGVPHGTRYDALRMLGVETWSRRGSQLVRYLAAGTPGELQMGAVSGLGDMPGIEACAELIGSLPHLTESNRKLALDALMRDAGRREALRTAVRERRVDPEWFEAEQRGVLVQPD